jgi:hypothetical protein
VRFKKDLGNPERFDFNDEFVTDRDGYVDECDAEANTAMIRYLREMEALDRFWRIAELPLLH